MVQVDRPDPPRRQALETPGGFEWRTCFCGATTVLEPINLPEAQRKRCPICETNKQTVIRGHLVDVEQAGADQKVANSLRNGRIVLVVDD